ncbi:MAG: DNA-binding protein [Chloroflexi bacterium RBG_13_51_52]|nr:MAG: DNA-binding protein [Chloroflexi bacterium RBG_13_51_52]
MPEWTFITRHAVALSLISKYPRITALDLGARMGITERAVRKIIADISAAGYIGKKKEGRGMKYTINPGLSLRQDSHREVAIGDLLASLGWKRNQKND